MSLEKVDDLFLDTLDAMVELIDEEKGLEADNDSARAPIPVEKSSRSLRQRAVRNTDHGSSKSMDTPEITNERG